MSENPGDIFFHVDWLFGFDENHPLWDETCTLEDKSTPEFELERFKIRSVRKRSKHDHFKTVTAYKVWELLTVDKKGEFLPNPYHLCKRQWLQGYRPDRLRPTKKGAYIAAIADIRKHPHYDKKTHAPLIARIKGQLTRARKS